MLRVLRTAHGLMRIQNTITQGMYVGNEHFGTDWTFTFQFLEGYVPGLQDAGKPASCKPDTQPSAPHQTSNLKTTARNTTGSNHYIILLSS